MAKKAGPICSEVPLSFCYKCRDKTAVIGHGCEEGALVRGRVKK
jgi:hypothetical protein